jgi:HEAT repeat protein
MERCLGLSSAQIRQLSPFFILAITLRIADLAADTLATSLFITHAGAAYLPFAYIFLGISSVPFYLLFSRLSDTQNHVRLMGWLMGVSVLFVLALKALLGTGAIALYYAAYIFGGYLWEGIVIDVLFPTLIADYFTGLEHKRSAWLLAIAMSIGSILGGGMTGLLATRFTADTLLLGLPVLYALVGFQVYQISRSKLLLAEGAISAGNDDDGDGDDEDDWVEALKTLPRRLQRYPMVGLLILSTLLQVMLSTIAEFQYLSIYAASFPTEQALTQFLSMLTTVFSLLEMVVLYCVTRPLLQWLGIPRMNLIYPVSTLLSFAGLAFNPGLSGAVTLAFNTTTLDTSIEEPVYTLNYNALPHTVIGEVRSLIDGLFYSVGIAVAGGALWLLQSVLSPIQLTGITLGISALYLLLHYLQGKSYVRSMQVLLQNRLSLSQNQANHPTNHSASPELQQQLNSPVLFKLEEHHRLGKGSHAQSALSKRLVQTMLRDAPANNQHQVLTLALSLAEPGHNQFASMALLELTHSDPKVVVVALQILGKTRMSHLMDQVAQRLAHSDLSVRVAAAAALASYGETSLDLAKDYLMSPNLEIVEAAIGAIAQVKTRRAADLLYRYLKPNYVFFTQRLVGTDQRTANALVLHHPTLSRDYWQFVDRILSILIHLEGEQDLKPICQSLKDSDIRVRARALELLLSLQHRRFVMPISSILEEAICLSSLESNLAGDLTGNLEGNLADHFTDRLSHPAAPPLGG